MGSTAHVRHFASDLRAKLKAVNRFYARITRPRGSGLPNLGVISWFPGLLLTLMGVVSSLGITGSSRGYWAELFLDDSDSNLLWGIIRPIRSDEWLVQSGWFASQYQHAFQIINQGIYGGLDAALYNDNPSWDWSMIFRPHAAAALVLPIDNAYAIRWWLPLVVTMGAVYVFTVLLLPRAPIASAALAMTVGLSPLLQWWYLPSNLWPVAWGFAVLAAVVVSVRSKRIWPRIGFAIIAGYLSVTTVMSAYAPYIVAVFAAMVVISLGIVLHYMRSLPRKNRLRGLRTLVPLLSALIIAIGIVALWVFQHRVAVSALLSTSYPGTRRTLSGSADVLDFFTLFSAPFQTALLGDSNNSTVTFLGQNQSEASTVIMIGAFLCAGLFVTVLREWREQRRVDWISTSVIFGHVLILGFLYIPHISTVTNAFLLSFSTAHRVRMAFLILFVAAVVVLVLRLSEREEKLDWRLVSAVSGTFFGFNILIAMFLFFADRDALISADNWTLNVVALTVSIIFFMRGKVLYGSLSTLLVAVIIGWGINPIYRGFFNLQQTNIGKEVENIRSLEPDANWVNVGSYISMEVLFESGATVFGGVQTYPNSEMWSLIDPTGEYSTQWNRLAHVQWVAQEGPLEVSNPQADVIQVTFDSCGEFAQENVQYVLSDVDIDQQCVSEIDVVTQGSVTMYVYQVISAQ